MFLYPTVAQDISWGWSSVVESPQLGHDFFLPGKVSFEMVQHDPESVGCM